MERERGVLSRKVAGVGILNMHHDSLETEQPTFLGGYLEYANMKTAREKMMMNLTQ